MTLGEPHSSSVARSLFDIPMIELQAGYWHRTGLLRAKVLSNRHKACLGDALIAQTCIDRNVPLLTRDQDFRAFADASPLNLILWPHLGMPRPLVSCAVSQSQYYR
jgi:predicted nucleic acid-binding protein